MLNFIPQYAHFINDDRYDLQGSGNTMLIVLNVLLLAGHHIYCKTEKNTQNPAMHICVNALMIAVILQAMGHAMVIFGRIIPYYSIYMVLLIPMCINRYFNPQDRARINIVVFIILLMIFCILHAGNEMLCPYQFVWEG